MTTDTPARGYYINGESPVVTIVLKERTGAPIDHTTVVEKPNPAKGCVTNADKTACTNADDPEGRFRAANVYVTGPRAKPIAGPDRPRPGEGHQCDRRTVESENRWAVAPRGGRRRQLHRQIRSWLGEDVLIPGDFTVTLPAEGAALNALFADSAAATAAEIVAWLNGNKATFTYNERDFLFSDRAIAYVEGGKVSIRTRAVGTFNPTIQIPERISTSSADSLNGTCSPITPSRLPQPRVRMFASGPVLRTTIPRRSGRPRISSTPSTRSTTWSPVRT